MSYRTPSYGRVRRRRRAWPWLLGIVVLALIGAGLYLRQRAADRHAAAVRSHTQAVAVTADFLTAWSHGDTAAMAADATPDTAPVVRATIPALAKSLAISSATYTAGTVVDTGASPGAPYRADVVLQGLGHWRRTGQLNLRKVDGQWKVVFATTTVAPDLVGGNHLVRAHTAGTRGHIVLKSGQLLEGLDGELDGNMLGTVGKLTAAQATAAGPTFQAGDVGGLTGLERAYNTTLAGTPGASLKVVSSAGKTVRTVISNPVRNGKNVAVSFDLGVQHAAEDALASLPATQTGSLVAIDTRTGAVLAVGNHPYNGFSRAIRGHYPPGSTFKIITTTAALMSGKTTGTQLACGPTTSVDGRTFGNAEKEAFGTISLTEAFAKSCNTAFINLETTLPAGAINRAAALYGFASSQPKTDTPTSGPLPLTSFGGSVPKPVDGADAAAQAIGQSTIVTSPLQMASVAAAVASGTWRQPYVSATRPTGAVSHVLPAGVASTLRGLMADVVAYGTAQDSGLPGGTYGKTGTAEYGSKTPPDTVGWFVGFRGNVAFACQVGGDSMSGGFGATSAAPVVARFLDTLG